MELCTLQLLGLKEGAEEEPVLQPAPNPCVPGALRQQQCPALPAKAALRHWYKYCGNQTSSYS